VKIVKNGNQWKHRLGQQMPEKEKGGPKLREEAMPEHGLLFLDTD